jgi:hypothetical protein
MSQFLAQFNHDVHAGSPLLCTPRMPSWWGPLAPHSRVGRSDWAALALSVCAVRSPPSALSALDPAPVPDPPSPFLAFRHSPSHASLPANPSFLLSPLFCSELRSGSVPWPMFSGLVNCRRCSSTLPHFPVCCTLTPAHSAIRSLPSRPSSSPSPDLSRAREIVSLCPCFRWDAQAATK